MEKQQVSEELDELIQTSLDNGNIEQAETLMRNKKVRLEQFDC